MPGGSLDEGPATGALAEEQRAPFRRGQHGRCHGPGRSDERHGFACDVDVRHSRGELGMRPCHPPDRQPVVDVPRCQAGGLDAAEVCGLAPGRLAALLVSWLLASGLALADAPITAVPRHPTDHRDAKSRRPGVGAAAAPALSIVLPALSTAERGNVKAHNLRGPANAREAAAGSKGRPLAIGFGRAGTRPAPDRRIVAAALADAARRLARGAAPDRVARRRRVRIALQLPATDSGLSVRFAGAGEVFGPIRRQRSPTIRRATAATGRRR